ncbi:MAG: ribonuclease HII [Bacteroidales bacterium]|nr:ribonuclease HII [Bacteroidales bacterium]
MLAQHYKPNTIECGCDEAGRGCLAGPVYAAAVILPAGYANEKLNDSKQLTAIKRNHLRHEIEQTATAWAVAAVEPAEIDRLNILHASTHAMCVAVNAICGNPSPECVAIGGTVPTPLAPQLLLIDGNRFYNETPIPYECFVKGDGRFMAIAAASILAKTYRDEHMTQLNIDYPQYGWDRNKGYPTAAHYSAIAQYGTTPFHRRSFKLDRQMELSF